MHIGLTTLDSIVLCIDIERLKPPMRVKLDEKVDGTKEE